MKRFLLFVFLSVSTIVYSQPQPIKTIPHSDENFIGVLFQILFSPNGSEIITSGGLNFIEKSDYESGELLSTYVFPVSPALLRVTNDFKYLAVSANFSFTYLYDIQSTELIHVFEGHSKTIGSGRNVIPVSIFDVSFSSNNSFLLSYATGGETILWDLSTREIIQKFNSTSSPILFSPNDLYAVMNGAFWDINSLDLSFVLEGNGICAEFSSNKRYINCVLDDNYKINVWDWENQEKIQEIILSDSTDRILSINTSNNSDYLVASTKNGNIKIVDLEKYKLVSSFSLEKYYNYIFKAPFSSLPIQFHPNSDCFATAGPNGDVLIYDLKEVLASQSGVADWVGYE